MEMMLNYFEALVSFSSTSSAKQTNDNKSTRKSSFRRVQIGSLQRLHSALQRFALICLSTFQAERLLVFSLCHSRSHDDDHSSEQTGSRQSGNAAQNSRKTVKSAMIVLRRKNAAPFRTSRSILIITKQNLKFKLR